MIDIETMGNKQDAAILSIGACVFSPGIGVGVDGQFLENCTLRSNIDLGRVMTPSTVEWWLDQSEAARKALKDPPPVNLAVALNGLRSFIDKNRPDHVWANGTTFDLAILRHAYEVTLKQDAPWHYRQECCMRSVRAISELVGLDYSELYRNRDGVAHSALDDANGQAKFVVAVMDKMGKSKVRCV